MSKHLPIQFMTAYMTWANKIMLENVAQLSEPELNKEREALFDSISETIDHILVIAEIFLAHLKGQVNPHKSRRRSEPTDFSTIANQLTAIDHELNLLAQKYSPDELKQTIEFEFVEGGTGAMTREQILLHLVNHATYHRGFVSTLIYPLVGDSKASDITIFIRDVWSTQSS